jgi:hypothetical protein
MPIRMLTSCFHRRATGVKDPIVLAVDTTECGKLSSTVQAPGRELATLNGTTYPACVHHTQDDQARLSALPAAATTTTALLPASCPPSGIIHQEEVEQEAAPPTHQLLRSLSDGNPAMATALAAAAAVALSKEAAAMLSAAAPVGHGQTLNNKALGSSPPLPTLTRSSPPPALQVSWLKLADFEPQQVLARGWVSRPAEASACQDASHLEFRAVALRTPCAAQLGLASRNVRAIIPSP